jgi:hypothetical protein
MVTDLEPDSTEASEVIKFSTSVEIAIRLPLSYKIKNNNSIIIFFCNLKDYKKITIYKYKNKTRSAFAAMIFSGQYGNKCL